jgi:hypothetical protein
MKDALLKLLTFILIVVLSVGLGALALWGLSFIGVSGILYRIAFVAIVVGVVVAILLLAFRVFGGELRE